jgi:hypothetical protein
MKNLNGMKFVMMPNSKMGIRRYRGLTLCNFSQASVSSSTKKPGITAGLFKFLQIDPSFA